ncbi:MAG: bacteriohemerythrin [Bacteroidetes bacterium]|nr:bacteriohemerythrin [Bacteroidota bacterium]MBU1115534.1 bacteriohemerythrin [Bacteroidota bacterium]MBU1797690.1 bacteriohemerythrin [Bacteroidota bacterium]
MNYVEWDETVIVNHTSMDKEHKKMVEDTNKLYSYLTSNKTAKANKLLVKIVHDLKYHFETEDLLMQKSKIPQYISHKLEHERFYNKIRDILTKIELGKETLTIDHLKIVKLWFFNHLKFKDKPLANFLNEHNIK